MFFNIFNLIGHYLKKWRFVNKTKINKIDKYGYKILMSTNRMFFRKIINLYTDLLKKHVLYNKIQLRVLYVRLKNKN